VIVTRLGDRFMENERLVKSVAKCVINMNRHHQTTVKFLLHSFLDDNQFLNLLRASSVCVKPKTTANEFAVQLQDVITISAAHIAGC